MTKKKLYNVIFCIKNKKRINTNKENQYPEIYISKWCCQLANTLKVRNQSPFPCNFQFSLFNNRLNKVNIAIWK